MKRPMPRAERGSISIWVALASLAMMVLVGLAVDLGGQVHAKQRAHNIAASENHAALPEGELPQAPLSSIVAPTLVIHGTADPMFPLEHGQALADEIRGARLLTLDGAGHGVDRADWETIVRAILEHTAKGEGDEAASD